MAHLDKINNPQDTKKLSIEQLVELADEVRNEIISVVSQTGGHLASNLGTVELTLALYYVFDLPRDRVIWDVSHQTYTHKLLTGRRDRFGTLRKYHGLSGYCSRAESQYDHFGAGHASTSISSALGFAAARDLRGDDHKVIAVIGDGAMTGGLAFEGLNNAGSLRKDLLVVLNDNTWSISKNVGSISKYLTGIMADEKFNKLRREVWELTGRFKRRDKIRQTIHRIEESIKGFLVPGMLFEKLGFRYFGPIDGHDLPQLVKTLKDIKNITGPIMLHVATTKGKGFCPAEENAYKFHGIGKFDKVTGRAATASGALPVYTDVFGETMVELAAENEKVVAVTAAMSSGTGLDEFAEQYPDRFFDVGIAEGHAACFAAGLAADGMRPYLAVYSTFMQRAYDQVIHDMAIQKLPVVICMDRAGLVGNDGPTHHGVFDLAYLSTVPNVTVAVPKDGDELRSILHYAARHTGGGIIAVRYPRDKVPSPVSEEIKPIQWGTWEWLTDPGDVAVLALGSMVGPALQAAELLRARDLRVAVVNARFVKPFDREALERIRQDSRAIVTVEEGQVRGGFGQAVAGSLLSEGYAGKFRALGLADAFVAHGGRKELLHDAGLDAEGLVASIEQVLASDEKSEHAAGKLSFLSGVRLRKKTRPAGISVTGGDPE
ncbi:MAG TPA: 1-deoxy-D-xylulose-5-phosphate synthase [Acidobacteriota bacterium]|nr:1-deoxy-D-xylulose-5-phosphate synthase [Acidobacteriota bacterium]